MPMAKANGPFDYDVCLSYASEQRQYVSEVADTLRKKGLLIFYDIYEESVLWGKDLYAHLADIYEKKSRYCIIFASREYAERIWTNHELKSAQARAITEKEEYILPARFDQTEIPGINRNLGYIDLTKKTPVELAEIFLRKLNGNSYKPEVGREQSGQFSVATGAHQTPRRELIVPTGWTNLRLPKVTPPDFSKYQEIRIVLDYLGTKFKDALPHLRSAGCIGTVDQYPDKVSVRVERSGDTIYSLEIREAVNRDSTIEFALDRHRTFSNGCNATAQPYFDRDAGVPKLHILDFSLLDRPTGDLISMTKEELFGSIWDKMVNQLESRLK